MQVPFIVKFKSGRTFEGETRNWNDEMELEIKRIFSTRGVDVMYLRHTEGLLCLNLKEVEVINFQIEG